MIEESTVYPLSAIPVYHVKDTELRVSKETLKELENLSYQECNKLLGSNLLADLDVASVTKNTNVLRLNSLKEAEKICKLYLHKYVTEICGYAETFIITNSWLTLNKKGSVGHQSHAHPNSIFSGCLYLDAGAEGSSINFHPKVRLSEEFNFTYTNSANTIYNCTQISISVQTGSMVIFPSSLIHSVSDMTSDTTRIALCFNTFVKAKFGNKEYSSDVDLSNISFDNESDDVNFKYD
jgi:uncharacterized protein (TIGR02466 family)